MPLPTQSMLPGFLGRGCPQPGLTLAAMTAALEAASDTDKADWYTALAGSVLFAQGTVNSFQLMQEAGDAEDIHAFNLVLDSDAYFYSPTNPDPHIVDVNATTVDAAIQDMNPTQVGEVQVKLGTGGGGVVDVPTFIDIFGQLSPTQMWDTLKEIFADCLANTSVAINWHFTSGTNSVGLQFEAPCHITVVGDIYLGGAPEMTEVVKDSFDTTECFDGLTTPVTLDFPSLKYTDPVTQEIFTMSGVLEVLFKKLTALETCCRTCNTTGWRLIGSFFGPVVSPQYNFLERVMLVKDVLENSIDTIDGPIPWRRFGRFMFINADQTVNDMGYIRYSGQEFVPPNDQCVGFELILNLGVNMNVYIKTSDPNPPPP